MKYSLLLTLAITVPTPVVPAGHVPQRSVAAEIPQTEAPKPQLPPSRRGDILMARKRYREAIEVYGEGVSNVATLLARKGLALHKLDEHSEARNAYREALEWEPAQVEALNNLGVLEYDRGNYDESKRHLEDAAERSADSAIIYCNLGTVLFQQGRYESAADAYERAVGIDAEIVERNPPHADHLEIRRPDDKGRFHFVLSRAFRDLGQTERAERHLTEAREQGFEGTELKDEGRGFWQWLKDLFS